MPAPGGDRIGAAVAEMGVGMVPTSGSTIQQRAHFSPSAGINRRQHPAHPAGGRLGRSAALRRLARRSDGDLGQIDRCRTASRRRRRRRYRTGAASRLEPITLSARAISSAPVTTRRSSRMRFHFSISAGLAQSAGTARKSLQMHAVVSPGSAQPRFFHGEAQDRREPGDDAAEDFVDHRARGAAARRRRRSQ